jgi:LmbE family N-acetylglucosaminyl deacetylase
MRKLMIFISLILSHAGPEACAQTPASYTSAELFLKLKKLQVLGSVLYIAAHPDDENSRLIAYLAKDRLYRTGYLSMTRGDGGQNLIGDEQGIELGLIRTQEMLAARRIDGAEQFFSRAYDFGFSKSTDEALKTWDKEKILSDVVWVIRRFQPDVIITRFPEDARAGHGHHSASAVLAHEAFKAAADPNRFPEQFKYGVKPWQAKRLLWNTFNFGGTNTTSENQLKIDVGTYNSVLGKSYGEIAAESRTQHKSQGAALTRVRGELVEYFSLVEGEAAPKDLMEGISTGWDRINGGNYIQTLVDNLVNEFSLSAPERSVPGLVKLYQSISKLGDGYWKLEKLKETQELIEACSGLWIEATTNTGYAVQGNPIKVIATLICRSSVSVGLTHISMEGFDEPKHQMILLEQNKNWSDSWIIHISPDKPVSNPYWLNEEMSQGSFNVSDQNLIGDAQSKPSYEAQFNLQIEGQEFLIRKPVLYRYLDPIKGDTYDPLTVIPPLTAKMDPNLILFPGETEKSFTGYIKKNTAQNISFQPLLEKTEGLNIESTLPDQSLTVHYKAKPVRTDEQVSRATLYFMEGDRKEKALELRTISYQHIPRIDYFQETRIKFVVADVKVAGKRIGYIEGAGDKVAAALQQMGYEVTQLKEGDLVPGKLQSYDAIITGIRAYDVHPWLNDKYEVLMNYISKGGNLIVQYNRNNMAPGNIKPRVGPYPFVFANARITDENAQVNFLIPEHPVLNYPNKINSHDFDGWIQERGIYFAGQADSNYKKIFSMHDPNESELTTSLILADYGKGKFVYTGLVFFRELPAGIPGAYRLMANIIALNQK